MNLRICPWCSDIWIQDERLPNAGWMGLRVTNCKSCLGVMKTISCDWAKNRIQYWTEPEILHNSRKFIVSMPDNTIRSKLQLAYLE